jgi:hypothetical protein
VVVVRERVGQKQKIPAAAASAAGNKDVLDAACCGGSGVTLFHSPSQRYIFGQAPSSFHGCIPLASFVRLLRRLTAFCGSNIGLPCRSRLICRGSSFSCSSPHLQNRIRRKPQHRVRAVRQPKWWPCYSATTEPLWPRS